jgi:hypothetical protein
MDMKRQPGSPPIRNPGRCVALLVFLVGCVGETEPAGPVTPGAGGPGAGGSAGAAETGRPPPAVEPGAAPTAGTGGSPGSGASGSGGSSGNGGSGGSAGGGGSPATPEPTPPSPPDSTRPDAGAPGDGAPAPGGPPPGPTAPGQGPTAEGRIVYAQDFENGHEGITFSPTNLPASRGMLVDDPLGQRGKVMRMQYLPGDNYRIGMYRPRANISNTGFRFAPGDRMSYAWGYMTETPYIGATLAQLITGGDPIWMLRGRANGELDVIPGGNGLLPFRMQAKKWHDIRVEIYYVGGGEGTIDAFIDGEKVFSRRGGLPIGDRPHWDGGIYLTSFGEQNNGRNIARTVYISNLSVGRK